MGHYNLQKSTWKPTPIQITNIFVDVLVFPSERSRLFHSMYDDSFIIAKLAQLESIVCMLQVVNLFHVKSPNRSDQFKFLFAVASKRLVYHRYSSV